MRADPGEVQDLAAEAADEGVAKDSAGGQPGGGGRWLLASPHEAFAWEAFNAALTVGH